MNKKLKKLAEKLNDSQKRFADEYLIDLHATRAYQAAYPNVKKTTAAVNGCKALTNTKIQAYISEKQKQLSNKLNISAERVLKEYARLGFYNIKDLLEEDGALKKISEMSDDSAAAIQGVDIVTTNVGAEISQTKKIKLAAKTQALEALSKHLGLFKGEGQEQSEPTPIKIVIERENGRKD